MNRAASLAIGKRTFGKPNPATAGPIASSPMPTRNAGRLSRKAAVEMIIGESYQDVRMRIFENLARGAEAGPQIGPLIFGQAFPILR